MSCHEIIVMIDSFIEQAGYRTMYTTITYDVNFITSTHRHRKIWNASENILKSSMYLISPVK